MKQKYLQSRIEDGLSDTTIAAMRSRLAKIPDAFLPSDPAGLHKHLIAEGYSPYTIKQMMTLATQVAGSAAFASYMKKKQRAFANVYAPKKVPLTFDEALASIKSMPDGDREFALGLLASGLRISEAAKLDESGQVVGKGSKLRAVANADMVVAEPPLSIDTFRRRLKEATGLTPHQLRKLAATKFVELGAREAELCGLFGWSSFQTASIYIQAQNTDTMAAKVKGIIKDGK